MTPPPPPPGFQLVPPAASAAPPPPPPGFQLVDSAAPPPAPVNPGRPAMATRDPNEVDPVSGRTRGDMESELANSPAQPGWQSQALNVLREIVRMGGQTATDLAKGAVGLGGVVEQGLSAVPEAVMGRDIETPVEGFQRALSPVELAPQNRMEEVRSTITQALGGVPGGMGTGAALAKSTAPVTKGVGATLADQPVAQTVGATTSALGAEGAKEAGAGETGQALAGLVAGVVPGAPGAAAARSAPKAPPANARAETPQQVARAADFKLAPSETETAGKIPRALEAMAGSSQLKKGLAVENEQRATQLAREELGVAKDARLDKGTFTKLKEPHNKAYNDLAATLGRMAPDDVVLSKAQAVGAGNGSQVQPNRQIALLRKAYAGLGEMEANDVLREIRSLREKASSNQKVPFGTKNRVEMQELGRAQQEMADVLDDWLSRSADQFQGISPDLAKAYKEARTSLAKINTVERATQGNGMVSAAELRRAAEKNAPLSGRLKIIADSAGAFEESMGKGKRARASDAEDSMPSSPWVVQAGQWVLRPAIKRILESSAYQNTLGSPSKLGVGQPTGAYFNKPGPDFESPAPVFDDITSPEGTAARRAKDVQDMAGDLTLEPEGGPAVRPLPPAPTGLIQRRAGDGSLDFAQLPDPRYPNDDFMSFEPTEDAAYPSVTVDAPLPLRLEPDAPQGGIPFRESRLPAQNDMAGDLEAATPSRGASPIPGGQAPRAAAMADDLTLAEDAPVVGGPNRRTSGLMDEDLVDFDPTPPAGPYRGPNTDMNFRDERPVSGVQRGAAVNMAGDLTLADDIAPIPGTAEGPDLPPGGPQGGPPDLPPELFRGVGPGRNPYEPGLGDALFWAPDEYGPTGAASYAAGGGQVVKQTPEMKNPLRAGTLQQTRDALRLPPDAELTDIIQVARDQGYDWIGYDLKPGWEWVQLNPSMADDLLPPPLRKQAGRAPGDELMETTDMFINAQAD